MNHFDPSGRSSLSGLAQEVRQGGRGANERFVLAMRPQLERMVRQTVRRGASTSPQGARILEEYHRLCQSSPTPSCLSGEEIVSRVATRLCETMLAQLLSEDGGAHALETVRG